MRRAAEEPAVAQDVPVRGGRGEGEKRHDGTVFMVGNELERRVKSRYTKCMETSTGCAIKDLKIGSVPKGTESITGYYVETR